MGSINEYDIRSIKESLGGIYYWVNFWSVMTLFSLFSVFISRILKIKSDKEESLERISISLEKLSQ